MELQELRDDQARELVNTQQRFQAYLDAREEVDRHKGSMSFVTIKGSQYLVRHRYDKNGVRKASSLGLRGPDTEGIKERFDAGKNDADGRLKDVRDAIDRQARINKAIGLGRVPRINARILRRLDSEGLMDSGARLIGTNCIFAYEAAAGVFVVSDLTTTEDVDILMDARARLKLATDEDGTANTLMGVLQKVDRSFKRTPRTFQAANRDGFLVDLVKPTPRHPERPERSSITDDPGDLVAAEIEGLYWHVNSPIFSAMAIDVDGFPVRIFAPDPVAFAVHKLWLSKREDRNPAKKRRDARQAEVVAKMASSYLPQHAFRSDNLLQFPREVVEDAARLFEPETRTSSFEF